jgi:hypothetical protein
MGDLGKLPWLSFFSSDKYRVIAMLIVATAWLLNSLGRKLLYNWRFDRQDERRHKEELAKIVRDKIVRDDESASAGGQR